MPELLGSPDLFLRLASDSDFGLRTKKNNTSQVIKKKNRVDINTRPVYEVY